MSLRVVTLASHIYFAFYPFIILQASFKEQQSSLGSPQQQDQLLPLWQSGTFHFYNFQLQFSKRRRQSARYFPNSNRILILLYHLTPICSAKYRGKGTDLSKVDAYKQSTNDSGSAEYQIARLSARVLQLTAHLQKHTKDYSTRRGLMAILSQRKQLMLYLQRTNRASYDKICSELNIRPLKNAEGIVT
jgi:small subunit ribosomal protein S15